MQFTNILTVVVLLASSGALASPANKPNKPNKPEKPVVVIQQANQCGNGAAPYCCNTDNSGKYTTCSASDGGQICGGTTVCCNAVDSNQSCIGQAGKVKSVNEG